MSVTQTSFEQFLNTPIHLTDPDVQVQLEVSTAAVEEPEPELGRHRLWADVAERGAQSIGDYYNSNRWLVKHSHLNRGSMKNVKGIRENNNFYCLNKLTLYKIFFSK